MLHLNIYDNLFTHAPCSNYLKQSKYITWHSNRCHHKDAYDTFYTESHIDEVFKHEHIPGKKYAWLIESKDIMSHAITKVLNNIIKYTSVYDMIFTNCDKLIELNPDRCKWLSTLGIQPTIPTEIPPKSKIVSCISSNKHSCAGHKERLTYVMSHRHEFDLYGRGIRNINTVDEGLKDYMFSVTIENAQYNTYFTEKILNCFALGTIPIYRGCPRIGDFFDTRGIIELTDDFDYKTLTSELYYSKMDAILDNFETCKKYEVAEDYMYLTYLINL